MAKENKSPVSKKVEDIKPEDKARLLKFRDNPSDESWMEK